MEINASLKRRLDYVKDVYDNCKQGGEFSITKLRNKYGIDRDFQRVFVKDQEYVKNTGNAAYPKYEWTREVKPNVQMVMAINDAAKRGKVKTPDVTTIEQLRNERDKKLDEAIKVLKEYRDQFASKIKAIDEVMTVLE
jgi:hypothetical protein